jgi:hypothetical protein
MIDTQLTSYDLSRVWFDWCFDNPEKINPNHTAIYFFAVEHCNRLGWKEKFGFPTQMSMDAIGIKKHSTYIKYFYDLCEWGFFKLIQKSTNQYSANIISLVSAMPKNGKALGKAIAKHGAKQTQSMGQSKRSIDKPLNQEPLNNSKLFKDSEYFDKKKFKEIFPDWPIDKLKFYYESAIEWSDEKNGKKKDWARTIKNWAAKHEKEGKINFNRSTSTILSGIING